MALLSICTVQGRAKWSRSRITCILSVRSIKCTKHVYSIYMFAIIFFYLPLSFIMMMILLLALCLRPVYFCSIRNCVRTAFYLQILNDDKRESSWGGTNVIYIVSMLLLGSSIRPCCWWLYLSDWLLTDVVSHHQAASASYTVHIIV